MITERRIFQAKVGQADALVKVLKDGQKLFDDGSGWPPSRIYTDYMSGQTDRVVWEFDFDSLGAMEAEMAKATTSDKEEEFGKWFNSLSSLIEGATVEHWRREE